MPNLSPPGSMPGYSSLVSGQPSIADQVKGETEDERKKRLQAMQNAKGLPAGFTSLADGYGSALSSS